MKYDVIIVGGGPAGLTAGLYSARHKLKTAVFEEGVVGGQITLTTYIENYPGTGSLSGMELAARMKKQTEEMGATVVKEHVIEIKKRGEGKFNVKTERGTYECKTIIIATGAAHRKLGIKSEDDFVGKGVSFCSTCDAPLFQDKTVAVIGGGNSALESALYIADIAKETYIIHRRNEFRGEEYLAEKISKNAKIEVLWDTLVTEIKGKTMVEKLILKNVKTCKVSELKVDGVFIYVGVTPLNQLAKGVGVELSDKGFIEVDWDTQQTSIPGVFAAGDVTGRLLQIGVAVGEAIIASTSAYKYIKNLQK
jgi:thioredoxin reductase (NADPH)